MLGIAASSYAFYEDANKFKKRFLPVELAQALVPLFSARGVDAVEVLSLAGVGDAELTKPVLPAQPVQVMVPINLPPFEALVTGFRAILKSSRHMNEDELAHELAEQLPTLFDVMQVPLRIKQERLASDAAPAADYPERRRA